MIGARAQCDREEELKWELPRPTPGSERDELRDIGSLTDRDLQRGAAGGRRVVLCVWRWERIRDGGVDAGLGFAKTERG